MSYQYTFDGAALAGVGGGGFALLLHSRRGGLNPARTIRAREDSPNAIP